jgi:polyisoprenoid-binding protein YceI
MTTAAALFLAIALAADPAPTPAPTISAAPAATGVREFRIEDAWGRDTVEFRTEAPIEEIVGTSNRVTGVLRADPSDLNGPATSARVRVPVTTFHTGVGARDEAVAKSLGAPTNTDAVFTLDSVTSASPSGLQPNAPVEIEARGALELNGVRRPVAVHARLTYVPRGGPGSRMRPGNFVKLVARFDVRLDEFGVARSGSVLPLQVGDVAHVTVSVLADDASPEERAKYRQSAADYLKEPVN